MLSLGDGIYCVDSFYERENNACIYIISSEGKACIVETATNSSKEYLDAALNELGISCENVEFLALTHVHLDHAGGAGSYMRDYPQAKLVVHPRGSRHMADPSKLIAGVCEVYGREETARMYGEILPIDSAKIISAEDGYTFTVGKKKIITVETPGHAKHHNAYYDQSCGALFSGDAFGISYPEMTVEKGRWLIPTTSPVQFDPEDMAASIDKICAMNPQKILMTHFGELLNIEDCARQLRLRLAEYLEITEKCKGDYEKIKTEIRLLHISLCRRYGIVDPISYTDDFLEVDTRLNSQGLAYGYSSIKGKTVV